MIKENYKIIDNISKGGKRLQFCLIGNVFQYRKINKLLFENNINWIELWNGENVKIYGNIDCWFACACKSKFKRLIKTFQQHGIDFNLTV